MHNPRLLRWRQFPLMAALSLLPVLASADNNVLSIKHENDGMASSDDGHFTSGFELNWAFKPNPENWTQRLATSLPDSVIGQADSVAFRLVHQIYTPDNIERLELIEDDRPYAGLVYVGMSLYEDIPVGNSWQQATDLHLDVGLVGPSSLADSIQREVHRITNSDRPRGWDNQLDDEPLLNLTMRRQWWHNVPFAGKRLAHGPGVSVALGNLNTYASAGYGVRWGDDASGIPTLTPNPGNRGRMLSMTGWQWYLFANVEGYYVAHNLTLDGNVFSNSHSVDRKEWVGEAAAGLALAWDEWQVTYAAVQRTREFDGQDQQDKYGAITLSRSF
ncbi:lipid A deacylase LpxR family protein [Vreelandella populi]|uniref:Lipid A deacylase LpxR family protein n=1 Tax=Vreelandella populi TaxID=2498858 RepID=A0A3S0YYW7_9GAMM|nr:lipid A deacylase LpxR family protein [Halomonas populi]RUR39149.1 lipid A deacylase LpxR family protein [Halomonas populi]RUR46264.1 lipid A deacylase LpxR family protein [Halomonas populi]